MDVNFAAFCAIIITISICKQLAALVALLVAALLVLTLLDL